MLLTSIFFANWELESSSRDGNYKEEWGEILQCAIWITYPFRFDSELVFDDIDGRLLARNGQNRQEEDGGEKHHRCARVDPRHRRMDGIWKQRAGCAQMRERNTNGRTSWKSKAFISTRQPLVHAQKERKKEWKTKNTMFVVCVFFFRKKRRRLSPASVSNNMEKL